MEKRLIFNRAIKLWGGAIALYGFVGFIVLPWIVEGQLKSFLQKRLSITATINDVRVNPFTLSVALDGLDLVDADNRRLLAFEHFYINLQLSSIFSRAANFKAVHLDGLNVNLRRYSETDNNLARLAQHWTQSAGPQVATDPANTTESAVFPVQIQAFRLQQASVGIVDMVPSVPYTEFIDSINVNLENLSTLPQHSADQTVTIAMGNGSKINWTGTLSLSPVASTGQVELVGPYPELVYEYLGEQLPVRLEGGWFDAQFDYQFEMPLDDEPQFRFSGLQARLQDLSIREHEGELLAVLSSASLQGADLHWPASTFSAQGVSLDGFTLYPQRSPNGQINYLELMPEQAEGVNEASSVANADLASPWQFSLEALELNNWLVKVVDAVPQQPFVVDIGLNLRLADLSNAADAQMLFNSDINIGGHGALGVEGALQILPAPQFEGTVQADLSLGVAQTYIAELANVTLDSGELSFGGHVHYSASESGFSGRAQLQDLFITDLVQKETLFTLSSLAMEDVGVGYENELAVNIGAIEIREPYARVEIAEDGTSNISRTLIARAEVDEPIPNEEVQSAARGPVAMTVQRILIDSASADFSDLSLPLPFAVKMANLGGEVSALSTRSREPARIDIEGQVNEFGSATIKGELLPLAYTELAEVELTFRNLDIPSMTPYAIKFAGRHIDDGRMDVDLSYTIHDGQMVGANTLVLRDLELGEQQEYPGALDLPLGLAIALLKNSAGVVDLNVPVTGDINNPQFAYGPVISQALANIIRNIVASPFKLLAGLVGADQDSEIGAIGFVPGRSDLMPPEREKLLQLAQALAQRPQLALDIGGVYQREADTAALSIARVDERVRLASSAERVPGADAPTQMRVLEALFMSAAPERAEQALANWRLDNTSEQGAGTEIDELAYAGDIRRALIALETVTDNDLEALAVQRAQSIVSVLSEHSAELAERIRRLPSSALERGEGDDVTLALVLVPL